MGHCSHEWDTPSKILLIEKMFTKNDIADLLREVCTKIILCLFKCGKDTTGPLAMLLEDVVWT